MEKEKLQHYSIRKLSVGAASVLIGLSFVGMHDSSLVKADTVNDAQAQQTKQVQQQKNEEQSHVPVVVAKTQNDQQVVQDQNKDSQAQNGNKQSAVVNKVAQSTSTTQTTDKTTNVETNEQLSQKNTQTDSANQKATVAQAQQSGNSKLSKNDVTIKLIQSSVANTDFKKGTSTNSLTIKPIKSRVNDIRTLLLAQKSVETNPVKKSNLELNKVGNTQGEHSALSNTTRLNNLQDPIHFGLKGSFKVDGAALNSIGAQIKLADITESNNLNSNLNFNDLQPDWAWIDNDENIGTFSLQQNDPHHMSLLLKMTKNKDFVGDVDINISTADSFSLNLDVPASQYKGVSDSNPAVSTINTGNHSYKIVMPFNSANYHEYEYQDSKVSTWQNGDTAAAETAYLTFVDDNLNKHDLVQELEQSQGASMSAKLQNLKRVVQISGSNISENMDDYNPIQRDDRILVIDANGRLTNDSISVDINSGVKKQLLANNLTPQEIYDQTAPDTYGFSKQIDGSWLISCNLSPSNSQMANNLESRIRDRSIYANIIDPQNADKIVQNTLNFYKGALQNTPLQKTIGVFLEDGRQTDFTVKDLTPGDNRHNQATGFVGESTSNADGSIARYVNVQTVDDDNNQMIIGKPQIYRGKSGTSVSIKYTVPQNYELVPDQSIPVQYTLQDTNSPIVIHLRHERQNAIESKVVAETVHYKYEDGSKAADDYNAKHVVLDRTGYKDLVTGKTVYDGDWSTGQFAEVAFPKINGYTATVDGTAQGSLATVNVDGNTPDIDKTVIYKANDQTIIVNYIDDTANKTINTDKRVGKSDTSSNYSTRDAISNYQKQGYDLVSDDTNGSNLIYDKDDQHDQVYAVHFKHHISTVTDPKLLTATFDRTVNEKHPDGKNKQFTQHYVINRTGTQDQVTKAYTFGNWSNAAVHEDDGDVFDGYTAVITKADPAGVATIVDGKPVVKAETFTNENNNAVDPVNRVETVEISYNANTQKAHVNYIDDTINQLLMNKELSGKSNTDSGYNTQNQIADYIKQGYDLISDDTNGKNIIFDAHDKLDQVYTVHFKHHISAVTDPKLLTATFDRTVNEKQPDGKIKQTTQHYVINRTGTQDQVTKAYTFGDWTKAQVHEDDGDVFDGYTAVITKADPVDIATIVDGKPVVEAETFTNENNNATEPVNKVETVEISYDANTQRARVNYIDDTDNTLLVSKKLKGDSDTDSSYNTKDQIAYLLNEGYDLVSDETDGKNIVFDNHDKVDQVYEVHVTHHFSPVTDQRILTATFDRTITEKLPSGENKQITQHYVITRTGTQDQVTKKYNFGDWSVANVHEDKIDVPEGYTAHINNALPGEFISIDDKGIPVAKAEKFTNENGKLLPKNATEKAEIVYSANPQTASITYVDDTTGQTLQKTAANGLFGEKIAFDPKAADTIQSFINKGYELVSNNFKDQNYAADNSKNEFTVHLKHGTVDVTRSKTINETIHYVYSDGTKAHDDYVVSKKFIDHGIQDKVTGATAWNNKYSPAEDMFAAVKSPSIPGYVPSKDSISEQKVNASSKDLAFTVVYTPESSNEPYVPSEPVQPEQPTTQEQSQPTMPKVDDEQKNPVSKDKITKKKTKVTRLSSKSKEGKHLENTAIVSTAKDKKVSQGKVENKPEMLERKKHQAEVQVREKQLPETGEDKQELGLVGLALASIAGMLGYSIRKKENE